MSGSIQKRASSAIIYPDTDDQPIAENTLQFEWIVTIKEGLDRAFHDRDDVFVAGDLFWYPVEGRPDICTAPDALVSFGRPRGHRGSYKQWEEGGIAPQAIFEVLSPGNRQGKMIEKFKFYEKFGVDEYYIYDPDFVHLDGFQRVATELRPIVAMNGWISPRLGIRFDLSEGDLKIYGPDGRPFLTYQQLAEERDHAVRELGQIAQERDRVAQERDRAAQDRDRAAQERDRIVQERDRLADEHAADRQRLDALAARLRAMGIDPAE